MIDDRLSQMFTRQLELQRQSFGVSPSELDGDERADYLRSMGFALIDEVFEAMAEVSWKPWANDRGAVINRDAYVTELVDVWFFTMNLLHVVGCTPEEFFNKYADKAEKNRRRQEAGYTSRSNKCSVCYRGLDDDGAVCTSNQCGYTGTASQDYS
jgi:hypothetical protein